MTKAIATLYVQTDKSLLLRKSFHEGGYVLDVIGTEIRDYEKPNDAAMRLVKELDLKLSSIKESGHYIDHINKIENSATLEAWCYKLVLGELTNIKDCEWIKYQEIDSEKRIRELDKYLFKQSFIKEYLSEEFWEDQTGKWIDARLIKKIVN